MQRKKIVSVAILGALISLNSYNVVLASEEENIVKEQQVNVSEETLPQETEKQTQTYPTQPAKITPLDTSAAWLYTADRPYLEIHNPSVDLNETIFFAKDGSFNVDRYMWWNYAINQKSDNKYSPDRLGGKILNKTFRTLHLLPKDRAYAKNPIIDQYLQKVPMRWTLKSVEEFRTFAEFLKAGIADEEINNVKPVLLLEINNVIYSLEEIFESTELTKADKEFLTTSFFIPSNESLAFVEQFFAEARRYCRKTTGAVEGAKPEMKYPTIREIVFEKLLKDCKDFKKEKIVPGILKNGVVMGAGSIGTGLVLFNLLTKEQQKEIKKYFKYIPKLLKGI